MSLLEFSGLHFGYSDEVIIDEASGALHPGNVAGLVGINGGGKSTLLRIIAGELNAERGNLQFSRETRMAVVSQSAAGEDTDRLYDFVRSGRDDLIELERRQRDLHHKLEASPDDEALLARLAEADERYSVLGGHMLDTETAAVLSGLGFSAEQHGQQLGELSGGQRQKGAIGRALISDANLLIFDEPTNHLDLHAQEFFVSRIKSLPQGSAVLLVSHDRWLLNALCDAIWELEDGMLYRYKGNYSRYVPQREERREQARLAWQKQQEHIQRTEEYIRRNIAGQNTKQARGRRKILSRLERVAPPADDPAVSFALQPAVVSGEQVLMVEKLAFGYTGDEHEDSVPVNIKAGPDPFDLNPPLDHAKPKAVSANGLLIENLGFNLYRGERLGIVGPNGCGKTTLLRLLARRYSPDAGMVAWGTNAELGIFSQDSADISPGRDLMAEIRTVNDRMKDGEVRGWLARFGFRGDDVHKDTGSLSGGEKSRLSLAKIFLRRPNVLVMDEPTNHLDIYAREALEEFLNAYEGTIVLVTHDRALLSRICNRLIAFERADGGHLSRYFNGGYEDYVRWKDEHDAAKRAQADLDRNGAEPQVTVAEGIAPELAEKLAQYELEARKSRTSAAGLIRKQMDKLQRTLEETEQAIEDGEAVLEKLRDEQRSADKDGNSHRVMELQDEIDKSDAKLHKVYERLDEQSGAIEEFQHLLEAAEKSG